MSVRQMKDMLDVKDTYQILKERLINSALQGHFRANDRTTEVGPISTFAKNFKSRKGQAQRRVIIAANFAKAVIENANDRINANLENQGTAITTAIVLNNPAQVVSEVAKSTTSTPYVQALAMFENSNHISNLTISFIIGYHQK